ncbi:MAG: hypothetical protein QNK36_04930 [Colwellia sp.]|nr:hypothetical protein [Colwellia sp.]
MFLLLYQKYFLSNSKKIVMLLILFLSTFQNPVYGETCNEKMSSEKEQYIEKIEADFSACGTDEKCRKKVKKTSEKRPYVKQYKECVNSKKDKVQT